MDEIQRPLTGNSVCMGGSHVGVLKDRYICCDVNITSVCMYFQLLDLFIAILHFLHYYTLGQYSNRKRLTNEAGFLFLSLSQLTTSNHWRLLERRHIWYVMA